MIAHHSRHLLDRMRNTTRAIGLALFLVPLAACGSTGATGQGDGEAGASPATSGPAADTDATSWTASAISRSAHLRVEYRASPNPIPINEDFELEVRVTRNDGTERPITGARVEVSGSMPAHGHGMLREPRSTEMGDGIYRVQGMLLHMGGHWELLVSIIDGDIAHTADFVLDL